MDKKTKSFLKELKEFWIKENIPNVSELNWAFLNMIVRQTQAKSILEIWCANWYSTIWLANSAKKNWWKIISYDVSLPSFNQAKENLKKIWLEEVVEFRFWNILEKDLQPKEIFDFIFIDARKAKYLDFFQIIEPLMSKNCTVIFDDVIKFKEKMWNLYIYLKNQDNYNWLVLPIDEDDWVIILNKK